LKLRYKLINGFKEIVLLLNGWNVLFDEQNASVGVYIVLALNEDFGQELSFVKLDYTVENVAPAVAQNVAVVVRELKDGLAG
jgi:hypothetical protein